MESFLGLTFIQKGCWRKSSASGDGCVHSSIALSLCVCCTSDEPYIRHAIIYSCTHSLYLSFTILPSNSLSPLSLTKNRDVCTKYQEASKIVNLALTGLISQCIPGAKILDLCNFGTTIINTQAMKLYQKKVNGVAVERGVAFPVCVSVNDVICNHSPLASEETVSFKFWCCFVLCSLWWCWLGWERERVMDMVVFHEYQSSRWSRSIHHDWLTQDGGVPPLHPCIIVDSVHHDND